MSKYTPREKEIEAIQFTRENVEEVEQFTNNLAKDFMTERRMDGRSWCFIDMPTGVLRVNEGDYIVKKSETLFSCWTPKLFESQYELLSEEG